MIRFRIPPRAAMILVLAVAASISLPVRAVARAAAATPQAGASAAAVETYDVLLRGGRIVDGSGNPWFAADLAIRGDRIAAIGNMKDVKARRTIDASGLVVAT